MADSINQKETRIYQLLRRIALKANLIIAYMFYQLLFLLILFNKTSIRLYFSFISRFQIFKKLNFRYRCVLFYKYNNEISTLDILCTFVIIKNIESN